MRKLQNCDTIYMDGTFKSCPHPYVQFVTIHGLYHGRVLPFAMCLMDGKTIGKYRQLLQHIKRKIREITRHRFRPRQIVTDFELALLTAAETELPGVRLSGCYFHFCQSLWRRVQELGLAGPYTRNDRLRKCIRKFMAIGYLPLALVRQNFRLLVASRSTVRRIRHYPALQDFIDYIQRNYFNGHLSPDLWNVFNRDNDTRTNNHVEGDVVLVIIDYSSLINRRC